MNRKKEEETIRIYGELVARELLHLHPMQKHVRFVYRETLFIMLQAAFEQGAQYGLNRASQIAERAVVAGFSKMVHDEINNDSTADA